MSVTDGKPPRMRPVAAVVALAVACGVGAVGVWVSAPEYELAVAAAVGMFGFFAVSKALFPDPPTVPKRPPPWHGPVGEAGPADASRSGRETLFQLPLLRNVLRLSVVILGYYAARQFVPADSVAERVLFVVAMSAYVGMDLVGAAKRLGLPPEARRDLSRLLMVPLAVVAACFALPALAWSVGWLSAPFAVLLAPALAAALTVATAVGPVGVSVMFVLRPRLDGRHAIAIRRSRWRMHYGILQASQVHALLGSGDIAGAESRFIQLFGRGGWLGLVPYLQFTIARVIVAKGELREGVALMERAVRGLDPSVAPGDEFAVALLLAEDDPALALEAADAALAHTVVPRPFGFIGYDPRAEQHAARAWALAALGRADEAHASMREAEKRSNPRLVAKAAEIHWRLARARLALGDPAGAGAEARKGVGDTGLFGNLCRALAG